GSSAPLELGCRIARSGLPRIRRAASALCYLDGQIGGSPPLPGKVAMRTARIERDQATKGFGLGKRRLSHLPPRLITGALIVNTRVSKLGAGEETAKRLHGMATAAYPFLGKLDAQQFARLLGVGELHLGASLLLAVG